MGTSDEGLSIHTHTAARQDTNFQQTDRRNFQVLIKKIKTLAVHCHCDVCTTFKGFLLTVECPGSVYSIMPQWWHLMLLQDVAASFHQTTVSTVNFNSFQYSPPFQQYEIPLIPAVVISKVLLLQSNIMVGYVPSHGNHFSYVYPGLPTYNNHNVTQYTFLFSAVASCWHRQIPAHNVQITTQNNAY